MPFSKSHQCLCQAGTSTEPKYLLLLTPADSPVFSPMLIFYFLLRLEGIRERMSRKCEDRVGLHEREPYRVSRPLDWPGAVFIKQLN